MPKAPYREVHNEQTDDPGNRGDSSNGALQAATRGSHWLTRFMALHIVTEEGIVGRSYLQPYAHRNIIPAIEDLATFLRGSKVSPVDQFNFLGPMLQRVIGSGIMRIALSGLDMALWDAAAKAVDLPLAELLGSSLAPLPSYNSNGLWLIPHDRLAEEACELLKAPTMPV